MKFTEKQIAYLLKRGINISVNSTFNGQMPISVDLKSHSNIQFFVEGDEKTTTTIDFHRVEKKLKIVVIKNSLEEGNLIDSWVENEFVV